MPIRENLDQLTGIVRENLNRENLNKWTGVAGEHSFIIDHNDTEENIGGSVVVFVAALGAFKGLLIAYSGSAPALVATFGIAGTVGIMSLSSVAGFAIGAIALGAVCIGIDVLKAPSGTFFNPPPTPQAYLKKAATIVTAPVCSTLFAVEQFLKCIKHFISCIGYLFCFQGKKASHQIRLSGDALIKLSFNLAAIPLFPLINLIDLGGALVNHLRGRQTAKPSAQEKTSGSPTARAANEDRQYRGIGYGTGLGDLD